MNKIIFKGQICHSKDAQTLEIIENGYILCEEGISKGIQSEVPFDWKDVPIKDYGNKLLIPGLVDLHIHAPQYAFRGLGMDMELLDWLNTHAFSEESKYSDLEYAQKGYQIFVENLEKGATTRACIFGTLHVPATLLLMKLLEDTKLVTYVGKVNMDRNAPDSLREESADASVKETIEWLLECKEKFTYTRPILTPRFIPSCTDELMKELGVIQREQNVTMQSHLSENPGEVQWVKELCPWSESYTDAYDQLGCLGDKNNSTIMAHCVYLDEEEQKRLQDREVYIAHCPQSNTNLSSGIAPIREYMDKGLRIGLGSDVAGGSSDSIFRAMTDAIQVSKLYWRLINEQRKPLTIEEVFYFATKGGGNFFGKVGCFEEGYELDLLVLDDVELKTPKVLSIKERLERIAYLSTASQISAKYVAGNKIFDNEEGGIL